jgi:hypothetical protein
MDTTEYQTGRDGKYYRMADKKDWNKYYILSETEEAEEILKSQEIKENMLTMSGHVKNGHLSRSRSSGIKVVAPQVGTANYSRRKDTIKWERELDMAKSTGKTMKGSSFQSTIAKLAANTEEEEEEPAVDEEPSPSPVYDYTSIAEAAGHNKTKQAFDIIQKKYAQNLHVVDKLYQEKISLEEYTKSLEVELMKAKGMISKKTPTRYPPPSAAQELMLDIPSRQDRSPDREAHDEHDEEEDKMHLLEEPSPEMTDRVRKPQRSQYDPSSQHQRPAGYKTEKKLSAAEAAELFASTDRKSHHRHAARMHANDNEDGDEEEDNEMDDPRHGRSRSTERFASKRPSSANALHRSSMGGSTTLRSSSAPRNPWRHSYHGEKRRSITPTDSGDERRSLSTSGRKVTGLSLQLQADQDRYLQKRKFIEQQEKLKQKEQEDHEKYLEERAHRASAGGKAFTSMEQRQIEAQKQAELREAKKKAKEREERREQKAIEDEIEHKKLQAMKDALYSHDNMPWKEMKEQEDALRRERIEKRKQELAATASLPQAMEEHMNQMKLKKTLSESKIRAVESAKNRRSEVEEPEKVTERLLKQRQQWEQKLAMEKQKIQEQQQMRHVADGAVISKTGSTSRPNSARRGSATPREGGTQIVRPKLSIEKRHEQFLVKRQQKQLEREQKEKEELEKQKELERKKHEKLLTTKLPESAYRGTKASKLKHSVVAKSQQDEKRQKEQEEKKQHEKSLALKESGAVMKFLIKERMEDLKTKNPNYIELVATEHIAKERAKREKADYEEKLRSNKQRLEESLKARPSLLERHDKSIAVKQATTAGLMKIAQVLEGTDNDEFGFGNISDSDDEKDQKAKKDKGKGKDGKGAAKKNAPSAAKLKDDIFDDKEKALLGMNG